MQKTTKYTICYYCIRVIGKIDKKQLLQHFAHIDRGEGGWLCSNNDRQAL